MAGTTTNYGFPYPTGTDSINTGDTKIQELAQKLEDFFDGASASNALFEIGSASNVNVTSAFSRTTTAGAAFATFTSPTTLTYSFTPRASGLFLVNFSGNGKASASSDWWISPDISGGTTLAASKARSIVGSGTAIASGGCSFVVDGTANSAMTIAIQGRSTNTVTLTLNEHMLQVVYLG